MTGDADGTTVYDSGTVTVTVGSFSASAPYGPSSNSTMAQAATALVSTGPTGLNRPGSPITASASGANITITWNTHRYWHKPRCSLALWLKKVLSNPAVQGFIFLGTYGDLEGLEEGVAAGGFRITSSIKNDSMLVRAAEKAANNETVQRGLDALTAQLGRGNLNAGLGTKAIQGTAGILELRGAGGARLYIRQTGANAYEIVENQAKPIRMP